MKLVAKIMIPFLSTALYNWTNTDGPKEDGPPMLCCSAVLHEFIIICQTFLSKAMGGANLNAV